MVDTLVSYNPANHDVVGEVPVSSADEINQAVACARRALDDWRGLSLAARAERLTAGGRRLVDHAEELGDLLSREMGKPLRYGIGEVNYVGSGIAAKTAEIVDALQPQVTEDGSTRSTLYYEPLGVCAAISPWNYPLSMVQWLVLPALMAGNTVILKPSEETPLIAQRYVDTLNEFLPADVLQIVHGSDEQGKVLVSSAVDLIAFTGSRNAGKHILSSAAPALKRVILELGGKDPLVVLADADIEAAAQCAVDNGFENAGQMCVSTERVYVHASIAEVFERRLADLAAQVKFGIWTDEDAEYGPMVNSAQRQHVVGQLEDAVAQGARVLTGGTDHPDNFVAPTVLADCDESMAVMSEETFGPVLAVQRYSGDDELIRLANASPYGLGASIFGDAEHARALARKLETGMIGINKSCFGADGTPWVGAKQSGYGFHGSVEGHRQFAQVKVVSESA